MSVATREVQTPDEQHYGYVLGVLAGRCPWVPRLDREALFHEAYALDERKRAETRLTVPLGPAAENRADPARPVDERVAAALDAQTIRELLGELAPRPEGGLVVLRLSAWRAHL